MAREIVTSENREKYINEKLEKQKPKTDNQGKNLVAVKKHFDFLAKERKEGEERSHEHYKNVINDVPLPDWADVQGVRVLRSGDSDHVGVPANGKDNAARYDVIHLPKKQLVVQLKKSEIHNWLHTTAKREFEEKHGRPPGIKKKHD